MKWQNVAAEALRTVAAAVLAMVALVGSVDRVCVEVIRRDAAEALAAVPQLFAWSFSKQAPKP